MQDHPENTQTTPEPTPVSAPTGSDLDKDAKMWGMLCHLTAIAGIIIPFGNVIGPLVVWLIKKEEIPFVDEQGKESLNFQILVSIALLVCVALTFVCIGAILMPIVGIVALVFVIIAAVKANNGEHYRYPLNWRIIK